MKTLFPLLVCTACAGLSAQAQLGQRQPTAPAALTAYTPVERGRDHVTWERYRFETNRLGRVTIHTNRVMELETGRFYQADRQWQESREEIEIVANGALARRAPHQAAFATDVSSPVSVEVLTPNATRLKIRPLCLIYYDFHARTNVLIAELKGAEGWLVGTNEVVYPDAFTDLRADVRYTFKKSGLEQDIILLQRPPLPEEFGLNPMTTWLWVVTEFVDPPRDVQVERRIRRGWKKSTVDKIIRIGGMTIGPGSAFSLGLGQDRRSGVPVEKHWTVIDGRTFLIEEVSFRHIVPQLRHLQASAAPASGSGGKSTRRLVSNRLSLPPVRVATGATPPKAMQIASAMPQQQGLVLDFPLESGTGVVLQGDQTYVVTGTVNLTNAVIEGGTVVKYNQGASLNLIGPVQCLTRPYRPAVFTAVDDDSVGWQIDGSTGTPTNTCADCALSLGLGGDLQYLNIRYAKEAIYCSGSDYSVSHSQFVHCNRGLHSETVDFGAYNILMCHVLTNFYGSRYYGTVQHLTSDQTDRLTDDWDFFYYDPGCAGIPSSRLTLANSLTASITNGYGIVPVWPNHVQNFTSGAGVFQPVGAGGYYLLNASTNRNTGTTEIQSALATALKTRTTYPPVLYSNVTISVNTNFSPQAQRDTDGPDLGYHYDPLDYLCSCHITNATLTLTNGVAVGYLDYIGLWLDNGTRLVSTGSPARRNHLVHYNLVQEQPILLAGPGSLQTAMPVNPWHTDTARDPSLAFRFTSLVAPNGAYYILCNNAGWQINALDLQDCEIWGAGAGWYGDALPPSSAISLRNNLFQYAGVEVYGTGQVTTHNNRFGGLYYWIAFINSGTAAYTHTDNAFDGCWVSLDGTASHNAYLNGATLLSEDYQPGDIVTNLTWETGPLGGFYQPTNGPLIDAGSTNANLLGLYHYTTLTNQVKETNSLVDIGYHYVALDSERNAHDIDQDGVPDFLEDANGNGQLDPGETSWALAIQSQPESQAACTGDSAAFHVSAHGSAPLSYQWLFNGANLEAQSGSTLTLTSVQATNAGNYAVIVSNAYGSVTSAAAVLTVNPRPMASAGPLKVVTSGQPVEIGGSPTASGGTAPYAYSWSPTNGLDSPSVSNPQAITWSNITYNLTVTDVNGCTASSSMDVIVATTVYLSFQTQPSSTASVGIPFATQPVLEVRDGASNLVTTAVTVLASAGNLHGATAINTSNGVAAFAGLYLTNAGNLTLTFMAPGAEPVTSSTIAVSPGLVAGLAFTTQPGSATAGVPFAQQPVLQTVDQYGNPSTVGLPAALNVGVWLSVAGLTNLVGTYNMGASGFDGTIPFASLLATLPGGSNQLTAAITGGGLASATAALAHRWSFNDTDGAFVDSVSGVIAYLTGSPAALATNGVTLAGTNYIDLAGNGAAGNTHVISLLPSGAVTLEAWLSCAGTNVGQPVFDLGMSDVGEGNPGSNMVSGIALAAAAPANGGHPRSLATGDGSVFSLLEDTSYTVDTAPHYWAVVYDPNTPSWQLWLDGALRSTNFSNAPLPILSAMNDLNAWLGRSQSTNDSLLQGVYSEFRIWDGVLCAQDISLHQITGPNQTLPGAVSTLFDVQEPPTVALTSPPDGGTYAAPTNLTLTASASAAAGVDRVEFYAYDGTNMWLIGTATGTTNPPSYSLTWSNVVLDGNYLVIAEVIDVNGAAASAVVSVTVSTPTNGAPIILTQPTNQTVELGQNAFFSVTALGAAPLSYQWYYGDPGAPLPAETNSTLTVSNVYGLIAGDYFVVITNTLGSATSAVATLALESLMVARVATADNSQPPAFIEDLRSQIALAGSDATFSVEADGGGSLCYQWYFNGAPIPGATQSSLTVHQVQESNEGAYRVVVANEFGSVTSEEALLGKMDILHTFSALDDDWFPLGGLEQGSDGTLYGTTQGDGYYSGGGVFKVTTAGVVDYLWSFSWNNGWVPYDGLVLGSDDHFYGTTAGGGAGGYGTMFKITPAGTLSTLYSFTEAGPYPNSALVQGSDDAFYGVTSGGQNGGYGTVFKITPGGAYTLLHPFSDTGGDVPYAALVRSGDDFYGTTSDAKTGGHGTVFKITSSGVLTTLHPFNGADGHWPAARLLQGSDGNFYGTTASGGSASWGTVFRMTPTGNLTVLHSFAGDDGGVPRSGLVRGADGNFYGMTFYGGNRNGTIPGGTIYNSAGFGTLFQVTPSGTLTTLYRFTAGTDGIFPLGDLLLGSDGRFYGTTYGYWINFGWGYSYFGGILFRFSLPPGLANNVSVNASIPGASQAGSYGAFTITIPAPQTQDGTVAFSLAGSTAQAADYELRYANYNLVSTTITIPQGQTSIPVYVVPKGNPYVGSRTVRMTLTTAAFGTVEIPVDSTPATVTILGAAPSSGIYPANTHPTVVLTAPDSKAAKIPHDTAMFKIIRTETGNAAADLHDLVVHYHLTGTAQYGTASDYTLVSPATASSATIPAGSDHVDVWVRPNSDPQAPRTPQQSVIMTLDPSRDYELNTLASRAMVTIDSDESSAYYAFSVIDANAYRIPLQSGGPWWPVPGTGTSAKFLFTRTGTTAAASPTLTINIGGDAKPAPIFLDSDYRIRIAPANRLTDPWAAFIPAYEATVRSRIDQTLYFQFSFPAGCSAVVIECVPQPATSQTVKEIQMSFTGLLETGTGTVTCSAYVSYADPTAILEAVKIVPTGNQDAVVGGSPATFHFYRDVPPFSPPGGPGWSDLTVFFEVAGQAVKDTDFTLTSSDGSNPVTACPGISPSCYSIVIRALSTDSPTISITALECSTPSGVASVIIKTRPGSGPTGNPNIAAFRIRQPWVSPTLIPDTDGDGLDDVTDIARGFSPLAYSSSGNGIPDGYSTAAIFGDGIPGAWFFRPLVTNSDPGPDPWTDFQEIGFGTDPSIDTTRANANGPAITLSQPNPQPPIVP